MIRTARFSLSNEPTRVDITDDDSIPGRNLTVFPQGTGTLVICSNADGYDTGARIPVDAGTSIEFGNAVGREDIWLASTAPLDVDVIQTGVK